LKTSSIEVNSYHNNIIKQEILGNELEPFAISLDDGTIEGFFHRKFPIVGVMWHPERDPNHNNKIILSKIFHENNFWD
jgi:gamma-glutamyl-gamma-aminobutyrate hydrolase PuuD